MSILRAVALLLKATSLEAGGILDDERLLHSDGTWHRQQRKHVPFAGSCYYTHLPELPNGCQYSASASSSWKNNPRREEEKVALMTLYRDTTGEQWRLRDNWHKDSDPCWDSWYGVTCDEYGHVIKLELADNGLVGIIPTLSALKSLLRLDLSSTAKQYHGWPNRYRNVLEGEMMSLGGCEQLEELEISGNEIEQLPRDLYLNAGTLRVLSASYNKLKRSPLLLRRFTALHTMELDHNEIEEPVSEDLGYLWSMQFLNYQYNNLFGTVPSSIASMRRMRNFDISHNPRIQGELPVSLMANWDLAEWIGIMNTSVGGYVAQLCSDVPFCWRFMYDTHADLTWGQAADVPDIVYATIEKAKEAAAAAATTTTPAP